MLAGHHQPLRIWVLCLYFMGLNLSNRQIATRLQVSANTVGVHRANIMNALGVHKTAELVVYALQNGLVSPGRRGPQGEGGPV